MAYLYTKFENSSFSRFRDMRDMKEDPKWPLVMSDKQFQSSVKAK